MFLFDEILVTLAGRIMKLFNQLFHHLPAWEKRGVIISIDSYL